MFEDYMDYLELINWRVATDVFGEDIKSCTECPNCKGYIESTENNTLECFDCGLEWE